MKISQSLIKEIQKKSVCPREIKFNYIDGIQRESSDVQHKGNYFEYYILGSCYNNKVPTYALLKSGEKPTAQKALDELIIYAKDVLNLVGLDLSKGESQVTIETKECVAHIDHINFDLENKKKKALYDVKYTETAMDDRWNGWGDFDSKTDSHIQAAHYITLYHEKHHEWIPFYFLVFGKSKWVRIIKVELSEERYDLHQRDIELAQAVLSAYEENDFPAVGEFNKCLNCSFNEICTEKVTKPNIETATI